MHDQSGAHLTDEGFALLFEFSRGPSFAYDLKTLRIVMVNDAAIAYYGYSREEFLKLDLSEIVDSAFWDAVQLQLSSKPLLFNMDLSHTDSAGRKRQVHTIDRALSIASHEIRAVQVQDLNEIDDLRQAARRQLDAVLNTVLSMMRMRDPFTDRHQFRVAALVTAMLREMGIPSEESTGIVVGATVHDIGKQSVPSEILSFAGRLSPAAMELVRGHSQAGFDLIEAIDAPWPIAQMIVEHHERLDGSGYPHGLRSDATLLGSRVIAVADTAEAMMSHRPYRAALGQEPALAELDAGRGLRYDDEAVTACFTVIRSNDFHFPDGVL
ncbi:MAG: HD domain-containing phosphohydrolase [Actinomycetota bacterium]|nr:HD domain-containing phosphohydrolase [Actinomycetota bacterium]